MEHIELAPRPKKRFKANTQNALLVEVAYEVCNQVGGIYTVIRSKVPSMLETWDDRYCLLGPYVHPSVGAEFEPAEDHSDIFGRTVVRLRELGIEAHYGRWLVTGNPRVVLLNPYSVYHRLPEIKYLLWEHHDIGSHDHDDLLHQVMAFGFASKIFFSELANMEPDKGRKIIGHFHEWMAGTAIPELRREGANVITIFTTHATLLGRYLAMHSPSFYEHLPFANWEHEAHHFNIEPNVKIERAAAHGSHVFTTVSDVTARECLMLLGRKPDVVLPNGLNIERFTAMHEFQVLHQEYKEMIHRFVMGHFFQSYSFDLKKTLYFFTSGRFEYKNKGFDLTMEALARLNYRMQVEGIDTTVVMFFITKQPYHSINPNVLASRALMAEIREITQTIIDEVGEKLYTEAASAPDTKLPDLNRFVPDYWRLRLRRTIQQWKSNNLPTVVTHNLVADATDPLLGFIRTSNLVNNANDHVKIVYHPDFITPTNPLFRMEYDQFVRGCHLGIFPSYYEPWGYTPLECIARGVPAVTSDLSGFGDYVLQTMPNHQENGIFVVKRKNKGFNEAAEELTNVLLNFVKTERRDRINLRNRIEANAEFFDWQYLTEYYDRAYEMALERSHQNW